MPAIRCDTSARIHLHADDLITISFDKIIFFGVFQRISPDRTRIRNSLVRNSSFNHRPTSARTDRESRSAFASSIESRREHAQNPIYFRVPCPCPPLPPSQAGERLIAARFKPREGFGRIAILFFDRRSSAVRGGFRLPETVPTIPMKL